MPAGSPTENEEGDYDAQVTQSIVSQDADFSVKNIIRNSQPLLFILQYRSLSHAVPSVCWLHHKSVNELVSVQSSAFLESLSVPVQWFTSQLSPTDPCLAEWRGW